MANAPHRTERTDRMKYLLEWNPDWVLVSAPFGSHAGQGYPSPTKRE